MTKLYKWRTYYGLTVVKKMRGVERNTCKYKRQCGILVFQDTAIWENWAKITQDFFVLFLIFSCESTIISEKSLIKKKIAI